MTMTRSERMVIALERFNRKDHCDAYAGHDCMAPNHLDDPACMACLEDYERRKHVDRSAVDE